jgi:predicted DNA-binding protein
VVLEQPMTTTLIRKQVSITYEQNQRLKALAAATGRTEADLVREAVAQRLEQADNLDWKATFAKAHGMWADRSDAELAAMSASYRDGWKRRYKREMKGSDD